MAENHLKSFGGKVRTVQVLAAIQNTNRHKIKESSPLMQRHYSTATQAGAVTAQMAAYMPTRPLTSALLVVTFTATT
jgi:hypothetical protein